VRNTVNPSGKSIAASLLGLNMAGSARLAQGIADELVMLQTRECCASQTEPSGVYVGVISSAEHGKSIATSLLGLIMAGSARLAQEIADKLAMLKNRKGYAGRTDLG
jgi:hypothetical protein